MTTLYTGGWIFDGTRLLDDHAILVEGERITRLAPRAEFDGHAGEQVDTRGCTLLPGLIDCHVHLCYAGEADPGTVVERLRPGEIAIRALQHAQASLAGGITGLRDCGGKDYLEFAARDACNSGRFLGPTIRAAGRMICMTGGHGNRIARVADGTDEVTKAVREQIHAGCDFVKLMATGGVLTPGVNPEDAHYSEAELRAGVHEAHRFQRHTASHAQGTAGIINAVQAGIDSIEHGIFMDERCLAAMLERQVFLVPTCAALMNILAHAERGIPDYIVDKTRRVAEHHRRSVRMFFEAGGRIAMGTDAGTPFNRHGDNALELAYMVDYGLTPVGALTAATVHAADLLGLHDRGRIAMGAVADLLLVQGNPVDDITAAAHRDNHRRVVKNGITVPGIPASQE